jgi:hypothetical protein
LVFQEKEEVPNIAIAIFHALLVKTIYQIEGFSKDSFEKEIISNHN